MSTANEGKKAAQWSAYQTAIFDWIVSGTGHARIDAVAGSGKSTTLKACASRIKATESVFIGAFNRSIAEELRKKCQLPNVTANTLHAEANKHLSAHLKKMGYTLMSPDPQKTDLIMKGQREPWLEAFMENGEFEGDPLTVFEDHYLPSIKKLVSLAKCNAVMPDDESAGMQIVRLAQKHGIEQTFDECSKALWVLKRSVKFVETRDLTPRNMKMSGAKRIVKVFVTDFDDMLWLTLVMGVKMPRFDFIFIDESQDLNRAQQGVLALMRKPHTRMVYLGDGKQGIYGFAGADTDSYGRLANAENTVSLPLSITYRCAKNIVKFIRENNIHGSIEAFENAPDGNVCEASIKNVAAGHFVLCRNTAPLAKLMVELLRAGKAAMIIGLDLKAELAKDAKGCESLEAVKARYENSLKKIYNRLRWKGVSKKEIKRDPAYSEIDDRRECFLALSGGLSGVGEYLDTLERVFGDLKSNTEFKDIVVLSTFHKSKGLEADTVWVIEPHRMISDRATQQWEIEQEHNLRYVALTRAKTNLFFVSPSEWNRDTQVPAEFFKDSDVDANYKLVFGLQEYEKMAAEFAAAKGKEVASV
jgi:DNA helicase-2/ATP-dependent DNA helicase PcrA